MGFVGNLSLFAAVKKLANRSRTHKVIAMVRVAHFFDSRVVVPNYRPIDHIQIINVGSKPDRTTSKTKTNERRTETVEHKKTEKIKSCVYRGRCHLMTSPLTYLSPVRCVV